MPSGPPYVLIFRHVRQILEMVGTTFYVYISGSMSATLIRYGIDQTGGYIGFGNIALLSLFIYATGSSTGGHLNPLVTFSAIFAGVLPVSRGLRMMRCLLRKDTTC